MNIWLVLFFLIIIIGLLKFVTHNWYLYHKTSLYPVNFDTLMSKKENTVCKLRKKDIYIYIHVCMINQWNVILENILSMCNYGGIFSETTKCYIGAVGPKDQLDILKKIINKYDICEIRVFSEDTTLYERLTLHSLWSDAYNSTENYKILYLHTKGVTKIDDILSDRIHDWVSFMCYHLIIKYKMALNILCLCDICGVNFELKPKPHFSGNFWWVNSNYIKKLPSNIGPNYLDPEMWVCNDNNCTIISIAQSDINHYEQTYKVSQYYNYPINLKSNKNRLSRIMGKITNVMK